MDNKSLNTYPMAFTDQPNSHLVTEEEVFYNNNIRMSYFRSMEIALHNLTLIDRLSKINMMNKEHR